MFARSLLYLLGIVSLAWIVYVSLELTNNENKYNPVYLFSQEDATIIIVNELENTNEILQMHPTPSEISTLLQTIDLQENYCAYFSAKRNHLLLESNDVITKATVVNLFENNANLKFTGSNNFTINNFKGEFNKKYCYIFKEEFSRNTPGANSLIYDKNATASIIEIDKLHYTTKDIYLKEKGVYEYKSLLSVNALGEKVNDEAIFSSIISSGINSYQFFEIDYLRSIEPEINKSPLNEWIKTGLVQVKVNGSIALITDYINGQNPINVLNEFANLEPKNNEYAHFQNIQLSKLLPIDKDLHVYLLDDYVVCSSDKSLCEKILTDYKLGTTIAQSITKRKIFYDKLPKKVNHRIIEGSIKQATSIFNGYLLTTTVHTERVNTQEDSNINSSRGTDIGEAIQSFYCASENQVFVTTPSNKVVFIEGQVKKWTKTLDSKIIGKPELIDLLANDKQQLLISTQNKIHLLDINGNEVNGFPIQIDEQRSPISATFYRWQGAGYILAPLANGSILQFDSKGRELTLIKTKLTSIEVKPVIWVSANKPFLGVYDGSNFEMIELLSKKSFRKFGANNITHFANKPNEIVLFGIENNQLISYNQKGEKSVYGNYSNGKIESIFQQISNPSIVVKSSNSIHLINNQGIEWGTIKVPFSTIDQIGLTELNNGNLIVSVIDGIENNVYLYRTNGQKWKQDSWDASSKIEFFTTNSGSYKFFTIVDKLIVEYKLH